MISLKRKQSGFTIVELLIVIVVIGILAALVVTTFSGIQRKARNTERETDIKAIHGQLEAYFSQNNSYPALAEINDSTWRNDGTTPQMKSLDGEALKDPKGSAETLSASSSATSYGYAPTNETGGACTTAANDCTKYTLQADLEGGGNFTKTNLN
jgi:prepilin-type N-terminal cleavage/methylation domain-containing protein